MKECDIKWSISYYEYSYHQHMLIGDYRGQMFITNFYNYSFITPLSLWWAKKKILWRFKAFN